MTTEHDNTDHAQGLLENSRHLARAVRWLWDTAQSGGMCLALILRLTTGEEVRGKLYFDTDKADKNGRTTADRSLEALRAMGLEGDIDTIDEDTGGLDRGDCEVVIGINANGYAHAKFINAPRGGQTLKAFAPPPVDAKKAFFAQMKARAAATQASAKATGATPSARPTPQQQPRPTRSAPPVSAQDAAAFDADTEIPF